MRRIPLLLLFLLLAGLALPAIARLPRIGVPAGDDPAPLAATIRQGLDETREVWQALQADRFNKLRLGVRVLANDPPFKAALVETDQATAFDTMRERGRDLAADFMLATDAAGRLLSHWQGAPSHGYGTVWGIDIEPTAVSIVHACPELARQVR